jgi:hypothetical protein
LLLANPAHGYIAPSSFFDVFLESCTNGFPGSVQTKLSHATAPMVPVARMSMNFQSITPPPASRVILRGSDSGGGTGAPGLTSFFDVWLESAWSGSSFFDVYLEMAQPGGAPLPLSGAPSLTPHTSSFFDVWFECAVPGAGQQAVKLEVRLPQQLAETVQFVNPTVMAGATSNSFVLRVPVVSPTPVQPAIQLFRIVTSGWLGSPAPSAGPTTVTKFVQNPDATFNGIDMLVGTTNAIFGNMLADDFVCTQTGPVSDIHIWTSWLNDNVDRSAAFWLGIWSDVPATNNIPSHPGTLVWWQMFLAGQYQSGLASTIQMGVERFCDPSQPAGLKQLGVDRQIWKYDFYPQTPFVQQGSPNNPKIYWLSVIEMGDPAKRFGWKTTRDHHMDYAVYAPAQIIGTNFPPPLANWSVIADPEGRKRELAFSLTTARRWACNKDFYNPWALTTRNLRVVLAGPWGISGHFDGFGGTLPQFSSFRWDLDGASQTTMDWTDGVVNPGDVVHVGFEGPGLFPPFLNWGWWNPFTMSWMGWVPQVSLAWPRVMPTAPFLIGITNIVPIPGLTNSVSVQTMAIAYYTNEIALTQLNASSLPASPFATVNALSAPQWLGPGENAQIQVDAAPPPKATYAVVMPVIAPVSAQGLPDIAHVSRDFVMIPLSEVPPPILPADKPQLQPPSIAGSELTLTWSAVPGTTYRVQSKVGLSDVWLDEDGDVIAGDATASKTLTLSGSGQAFYRVMSLLP